MVLEKTLESPSGSKEIKLANLKGNQPWIFIGRTEAEVEAPIFWLPDAKSQLIGKDWGRKRRVWQRMRRLDGITNSMDMGLSKLLETVKEKNLACFSSQGRSQAWLSNRTTAFSLTLDDFHGSVAYYSNFHVKYTVYIIRLAEQHSGSAKVKKKNICM